MLEDAALAGLPIDQYNGNAAGYSGPLNAHEIYAGSAEGTGDAPAEVIVSKNADITRPAAQPGGPDRGGCRLPTGLHGKVTQRLLRHERPKFARRREVQAVFAETDDVEGWLAREGAANREGHAAIIYRRNLVGTPVSAGPADRKSMRKVFVCPDRGFTLVELLIVVAVISVIAAIAVPGLLRSRMTANEVSAIASLRLTSTAQIAYAASCGDSAFASSFVVLATPPTGTSAPFISSDLGRPAPFVKSGFTINFQPGAGSVAGPPDCNGSSTLTAFYATAVPQSLNITGSRAFAINNGKTVWQNTAGVAPLEPFTTSPTVTPIQ